MHSTEKKDRMNPYKKKSETVHAYAGVHMCACVYFSVFCACLYVYVCVCECV